MERKKQKDLVRKKERKKKEQAMLSLQGMEEF